MQADFTLFIIDCIFSIKLNHFQDWYPISLVYSGRQYGPFEIFAKSQSIKYFNRVKVMFEIDSKHGFDDMLDQFKTNKLQCPRWNFNTVNPSTLLGYDKLETLP